MNKKIFFKKPLSKEQQVFAILTGLTLVMIAGGTLFYSVFEGFRLIDAFYFSVIALTTVGFGDFTPQTDIGKLFTVFYILMGIGILVSFINTLAQHIINRRIEKEKER